MAAAATSKAACGAKRPPGIHGEIQLAKRRHVYDGDDESEHERWEFVGEAKQPEEQRHRGQLDADAGQQQRARPIGLTVLKQNVAADE